MRLDWNWVVDVVFVGGMCIVISKEQNREIWKDMYGKERDENV